MEGQKMGKKILVFFLSFSMLALCACAPISGESSAESSSSESSAAESSTPESSAPESSVSESSAPESSVSESSAADVSVPEQSGADEPVEIKSGFFDQSATEYFYGRLVDLCWLDDTRLIIGVVEYDSSNMNIGIYNIATGEEFLLGHDIFTEEDWLRVRGTFDCDGEYLYYSHEGWSMRRIRLSDGKAESAEPDAGIKTDRLSVEGCYHGRLLYCVCETGPDGSRTPKYRYWENPFTGERSDMIDLSKLPANERKEAFLIEHPDCSQSLPENIVSPSGMISLYGLRAELGRPSENQPQDPFAPSPHDGVMLIVTALDENGNVLLDEDFFGLGGVWNFWSSDGSKLYFLVDDAPFGAEAPELRLICFDLTTGERTETGFGYVPSSYMKPCALFSSDGSFCVFTTINADRRITFRRQNTDGTRTKIYGVSLSNVNDMVMRLSPNERLIVCTCAGPNEGGPPRPIALMLDVSAEYDVFYNNDDGSVEAAAYCEKYIAPWCLNCPFAYEFDYRDPSSPQTPQKLNVEWLFANCWYLSHGESPAYDGSPAAFPADVVEETIGEYFPFPPELLRGLAVDDGDKQYYDGEYHFSGEYSPSPPELLRELPVTSGRRQYFDGEEYRFIGFGVGGIYATVNKFNQREDGLLILLCNFYSIDTDEVLLNSELWIEEHPDGSWRYIYNGCGPAERYWKFLNY